MYTAKINASHDAVGDVDNLLGIGADQTETIDSLGGSRDSCCSRKWSRRSLALSETPGGPDSRPRPPRFKSPRTALDYLR